MACITYKSAPGDACRLQFPHRSSPTGERNDIWCYSSEQHVGQYYDVTERAYIIPRDI